MIKKFSLLILFFNFSFSQSEEVWKNKNFDKEKYFKHSLFLREVNREKSSRSHTQSIYREEIRPRGASYDGRYTLFEKRISFGNTNIFFILFDLKKKSRFIYEVPGYNVYEKRKKMLSFFENRYQYNEGQLIRRHFDQDRYYVSPRGGVYKYAVKKNKYQIYYIDVTQLGEERRLLARYSLPLQTVSRPKVGPVYVFDRGRGFSIHIKYQKSSHQNSPRQHTQFKEDILCFNDQFRDGINNIFKSRRRLCYQLRAG